MRLNKRNWWSLSLAMFALLIMTVPEDAFGQRRGGGGRSRPSTRRSTPKAPPKAAKPKASPKRGDKTGKATNKGKFGSSTKKAGKSKKATKADQKAYDKAKANGTAFKTRDAASADFKKKNAAKYGSTYTSQPSTRPGHIPATYAGAGGTTYNISYNQGYGGYGYMGVGGSWIMYNAMQDAAMSGYYNQQMASAGYMYGPRPVVGMGGGVIVMFILVGIAAIVVVVAVFAKRTSSGG